MRQSLNKQLGAPRCTPWILWPFYFSQTFFESFPHPAAEKSCAILGAARAHKCAMGTSYSSSGTFSNPAFVGAAQQQPWQQQAAGEVKEVSA